jgi:hypothetical protein
MERKESEALLAVTERLIDETRVDQRFTAEDIRRMHRLWLGEIYVWAGEYRQVNVSKGGFMFAAAAQVPRLMDQFERGPLSEYTPCRFESHAQGPGDSWPSMRGPAAPLRTRTSADPSFQKGCRGYLSAARR